MIQKRENEWNLLIFYRFFGTKLLFVLFLGFKSEVIFGCSFIRLGSLMMS